MICVFIPSLTSVIVAGVSFGLIFGSLPNALFNWLLSFVGVSRSAEYGILAAMLSWCAWPYGG